MKIIFYYFLLFFNFFLIISCTLNDICSNEEGNLCRTENVGIGIENQDPFYSIPTPNPNLTATHRWLWQNHNGNLKIYSKGEVSDENLLYSVYEFAFNANNCIIPVLYSNFQLEVESILNSETNEYETIYHTFNYNEDTFSLKVEEFIENQLLKARIIYDNNSNLSKDIYAELILDNKEEIIN